MAVQLSNGDVTATGRVTGAKVKVPTTADLEVGESATLSTLLADKENTISDLTTIRNGASAGATAVQPSAMSAAITADVTHAKSISVSGISPISPTAATGNIDVSTLFTGANTSNNLDNIRVSAADSTTASALIGGKITNPSGGSVGNVLKKTATGVEWGEGGGGSVDEGQLRYALVSPTAGTEEVEGVTYTKYDLQDRATNNIVVNTATPNNIRLHLPTALYAGKSRDLIVRIEVTAAVTTIPSVSIVPPSGETIGIESKNATWATIDNGINYFALTETKRNVTP